MTRLFSSAVAMFVVAPLLAGQTQTVPASPAGKWSLVWANSPDKSQQLELAIDASKRVTGTLNGAPILGEFADGRLTFASPEIWQERQNQLLGTSDQANQYAVVNFATPNSDGTLAGYADNYLRGYGPVAIKRWSWKASRPTIK